MQVQAAVVEVHGPHRGVLVVHHKGLGMDEAGGVFVDAYAALEQHLIIRAGNGMDIPFVRDMGGDDPDVHPRFRCPGSDKGY